AAVRRRFNFETVHPIADPVFELQLVMRQAESLLQSSGSPAQLSESAVRVLVDTFHELRSGRTIQGAIVEKPSSVMSTAEAVSVVMSAGLDAYHFGDGKVTASHLGRQLTGAVLKDDTSDAKKVRQYFEVVVKPRAQSDSDWKDFYRAGEMLK
ncbi:MAG: AAA family ATPase, partial [Planctomycetota bacterium]